MKLKVNNKLKERDNKPTYEIPYERITVASSFSNKLMKHDIIPIIISSFLFGLFISLVQKWIILFIKQFN